jgi:riboflavin kinase/FMN adenylyltransferase
LKVHYSFESYINIKKPVVTVGTFDGVHIGHQTIIERLKTIAKKIDGETVLLTFYPHPRKVILNDQSNLKLINTKNEKIKLLEQYVLDHLFIHPFNEEFSRISPTSYVRDLLVNHLKTNHLVIGYNHQFGRNREGNLTLLTELSSIYDFNIEEISAQQINEIKVSSTKIRAAIEAGNIATANNYLGHTFSISGKVIQGNKLGRTIGFPTANIKIDESDKICPPKGVYAVRVKLDNQTLNGMMNIGTRPTIEKEQTTLSNEVHIFNFNKDIYNLTIQIEFIARIRE